MSPDPDGAPVHLPTLRHRLRDSRGLFQAASRASSLARPPASLLESCPFRSFDQLRRQSLRTVSFTALRNMEHSPTDPCAHAALALRRRPSLVQCQDRGNISVPGDR